MDRVWQQGVEKIAQCEPLVRGGERARLQSELDLSRMIGCMFRTALHLVRFQRLREATTSKACPLKTLRRSCADAIEILKQELVNAQTALTLTERDGSLGYGATYGAAFDAAMLQEKIRHTRHQIDHVVPQYYQSYAFHMFGRSEDL
jgi:hypothetical protein